MLIHCIPSMKCYKYSQSSYFLIRGDYMRKVVVFLIIAAFAATACTGTFRLTRDVYKFHRSQQKWADEIIFLAFVIVPVYGISTLADGILFNSIEFWTGKNPLASTTDANNNVAMKYDSKTQDIQVSLVTTGRSFVLSKKDAGVVAKDKDGKILYTSIEDSIGGVTVYDRNNKVICYFSPEQVQKQRIQVALY
jgi:hypothetical protein